jgi:uncharacterized protein DUF1367
MELLFQKGSTGLVPACEEATQWLSKKKLGATILVEPREMRNGKLFRKWWALVKLGYDYWSENAVTVEYRGQPVLPEFDRFRKDVTIVAGFHHAVVNIKGEVRIEADSLKWASMDEDTFTKLYDATIQVLLSKVFNGKVCKQWSEEQLRRVAEEVLSFAA